MALNVTGGALEFDAIINQSQFGSQIREMETRLKSLTATANAQADSVNNYASKVSLAVGSYLSLAGLSTFITQVGQVRSQFQQLEVAFTTMLGSKEKADKLLREVTEFAAKTPFELTEVATASKQLLAFGFNAEEVQGTLRSLGDIAAGLGQPLGEIAYLYGTIKTAGVANTVDLKQFAMRGIPIYEALADVLKVDRTEIGNLVSAGKIGFPEIEKAFQKMTSEGSKFGGLMEAQSKTLGGMASNFRDAFDQMLNDIGKDSEGVFASTIKGATFLVENYQTVMDVLKELILIFGAYKAAVVAQAAVTSILAARTAGYTVIEQLRYRAMLISEGAMRLLNKTMLANPFVAVTTAVAGLVGAFFLLRKESTNVKSSQELLAAAQKNVGDKMAETEAKIRPYVDALKNANLSEQERVDIYNKLKEIDPKIVEGLNAKTLSYAQLTGNVNLYLAALRNQYKLEANKEGLQASIKQENAIQAKIDQLNKRKAKAEQEALAAKKRNDSESAGLSQFTVIETEGDIKILSDQLKQQQAVTEELGKTQVKAETTKQDAVKRTLKVIDDEIKAEKEQQQAQSSNHAEFEKHQTKIKELEAERKKIVGETTKDLNAASAAEDRLNSILNQRKDILASIADLQRDAQRSGLVKDQSELDKVNEKYDDAIAKIVKFNAEVDRFNKKNKTNVQKVGIADIEEARRIELRNTSLKQDAEKFKENLDKQKDLFLQYEEAKKTIGLQKADELFQGQTKGFTSYLQFLKAKAENLAPKFVLGIANIGDIEKMTAIVKSIKEEERRSEVELFKERVANVVRLFNDTATYKQREAAIEKKFLDDVKILRAEFQGEELEQQIENRRKIYQGEVNALKDSLITQSDLYKKLNQSILGYSRERILQEVNALKSQLKSGTFIDSTGKEQAISPEFKKQIEEYIKKLTEFYKETGTLFGLSLEQLEKLGHGLSDVSGIFGDLASGVEGLNDSLASTFQALSDITGVASSAVDAIGAFAKGNIVQGIAATVKTIIGIFQIGKKSRESERKAKEEVEAFNTRILQGEIDITMEYRNRQREQVKLNKLRLDGLLQERVLLQQQKQDQAQNFQDILSLLQQQSAVIGETTKKTGGFLGIGKKTKVVEITETLAGKSFDELEKLFLKGQLIGKAKDLFEQLKKIKDEGVDIDQLLEQNKLQAQELFAGTTAQSITDTIKQGFSNGLRSVRDFAGTTEDIIRGAMLSALEVKVLEGPIKALFEQFAQDAEDNGGLDKEEVKNFTASINKTLTDAAKFTAEIEKATGIKLTAAQGQNAAQNTLSGAIRGITADQADLLAGQFGGQRIATLNLVDLTKNALVKFDDIRLNTANTVIELRALVSYMRSVIDGSQSFKIR